MFSGIGGFEYGIEQAASDYRGRIQKQTSEDLSGLCSDSTPKENGTLCVGYSEINKYASAIYRYHYPNHKNYGNAKELVPESLPDFDLLVGGFPCQAFSVAGKRQGFKDTRGTLFFDVARVLEAKRPEWLLLENVKGLCSHEGGETLARIYGVLADLGYTVGWEVVNSVQFGVPQNRERIFIVGHLAEAGGCSGEILPVGEADKGVNEGPKQTLISRTFTAGVNSGGMHSSMTLLRWQNKDAGIVESEFSPSLRASGGTDIRKKPHVKEVKAVLTPDRLEKIQNGRQPVIRSHHPRCGDAEKGGTGPLENSEYSYTIDSTPHYVNNIRRITPIECERLQGFPDGWTEKGIIDGEEVEISDTQRYKALGNAVTVNVIEAFMRKILN